MPAALLYCADPLNPRRVDPHFAAEAETVRALGGTVALVDHDALLVGDPGSATRRVPRDLGPAWYRGWMVPTRHYMALETALAARGTVLLTGAERYRSAHELPGWFDAFATVTPASVWLPLAPGPTVTIEEVAALAARLPAGPGLVKDYVKSRKHEWATACHIPDLADTAAAHRVVARFVELQEADLVGGIVLRAFEDLRGPGGRGAEARVWWLDGEPVLCGPHPDTPDQAVSPDLGAIAPLVATFGARFVTTDLAQRADGGWRLIEVGDGQVSDLPAGVDPARLVAPLLKASA